jgi:serine palmitoyltransferase
MACSGTSVILPNVYLLGFKVGQYVSSLEKSSNLLPSPREVVKAVASFPVWYKAWWLKLLNDDPVHVIVETTLLVAIVYFLLSRRSQDWKELQREKLSPAEEEELLKEWKERHRQPIVPLKPKLGVINEQVSSSSPGEKVVIYKTDGREMVIRDGVDGSRSVLNFATFDFLGMQADKLPNGERHPVKTASLEALNRYGCGSCGPRGFYGTIDVHLDLEKEMASFCGTDDAILYSDGASTVTSTIAAFCKRGDVVVVDEGVYEPIRTGIKLSRANVKWYKHADMEDLKKVLSSIASSDKKVGRPLNAQRRFLVTEALFKNTGKLCPLDKLFELKEQFKYRVILDESFSFGTIGATGRGAAELFGVKPEIVCVSLENSLGSTGAVTVGSQEVVDHQRLSGSGYCFSASSPPYTASAALAAIGVLQQKAVLHNLNHNRTQFLKKLKQLLHEKLEDLLIVTSDERSPIVILQVAAIPETEYLDETVFLKEVVRESLAAGVAMVATDNGIRITVSAAQNDDDIEKAVTVLGDAVDVLLRRFHEEEEEEIA